MTKKNRKIKNNLKNKIADFNIPFLILGFILILVSIIKEPEKINRNDLEQITVVLKSKINNITGTRSTDSYKFWTKNINAAFTINRGITISENFEHFQSLSENDTLTILIKRLAYDFNNKLETIPIYALSNNNTNYFSLKDYNADFISYESRLKIFMLFGGILFMLNGLSILKLRHFFIIAALFIIVVIVMNLFEFGLYSKN